MEWKVQAVIGDKSEGGDCDEVIGAVWGEAGQWTEWGWRNEEGSWLQLNIAHVAETKQTKPVPL